MENPNTHKPLQGALASLSPGQLDQLLELLIAKLGMDAYCPNSGVGLSSHVTRLTGLLDLFITISPSSSLELREGE